jgi:hypothetical protein
MRYSRMAWLGLLVFAAGCGSGMGQVEGKVSFQGKPLTGAVVLFVPERGPAAAGTVKEDGSYRLLTRRPGDGAMIGRCKVAIFSPEPTRPLPISKKYLDAETSGLLVEVKEGRNTIDFEIPDS